MALRDERDSNRLSSLPQIPSSAFLFHPADATSGFPTPTPTPVPRGLCHTRQPVEKKENLKTKIDCPPRTVKGSVASFQPISRYLPPRFPPPPPSPEASTSRPPPSQCRVRAGPFEDEDAQLGAGSCEARCAGVRVGVRKVRKSGSRWGGGAGRPTASGFGAARLGPWSAAAAARDGQSWAAGGAAGEGGGCSPDEAGVAGEDGGCVAAAVEAVEAGGRRGGGCGG